MQRASAIGCCGDEMMGMQKQDSGKEVSECFRCCARVRLQTGLLLLAAGLQLQPGGESYIGKTVSNGIKSVTL